MRSWLWCWFALLGCGAEVDEEGASALWGRIHAEQYETWERAPGYETPQPTLRAHGQTALVYLDATMADAVAVGTAEAWPLGSLLVKDSFEGGDKTLVAAMEKRTDGWYFAEWSSGGEVEYAGLLDDTCTGCHTADTDRVLSVPLP